MKGTKRFVSGGRRGANGVRRPTASKSIMSQINNQPGPRRKENYQAPEGQTGSKPAQIGEARAIKYTQQVRWGTSSPGPWR